MLKSVKRLSLQPKRWSRRLRAFYWPETTLFLFIIGSLYIVNPDFFLFSLIRSCYYGVTGAVVALFWESRIAKAIRGDIKFTSIIDLTALSIQEIFSLLVTMILVLFFVNNIVME